MYTKICMQCLKEFLTCKHTQKFCCVKCYGKWKSDHLKGENNPQFIKDKPMKTCPICKIKFYSPDTTRTYCSMRCAGISNSGLNSPVRNNNLKTLLCPVCKKEFRQIRGNLK